MPYYIGPMKWRGHKKEKHNYCIGVAMARPQRYSTPEASHGTVARYV